MKNYEKKCNQELLIPKYYLSYFAYFRLSLKLGGLLIVFIILTIIAQSIAVAIILFIVFILATLYRVIYYNSIFVYADQDGIWKSSGFFPWDKGITGVKWRDLDEALMFRNFTSWATKSYTIFLKHRYSKLTEIYLNDIYNGDKFVEIINQIHEKNIKNKLY